MNEHTISIVIADDEDLVRSGIRLILEGDPSLAIIGEAGDGQAAFDAARRLKPDVILLDLHMPIRDGVWACQRITQEAPNTKVLVLTAFDTDHLVQKALNAGAAGFLLKNSSMTEILSAIHNVASGRKSFSEKVLDYLVTTTASQAPKRPIPTDMTAREKEIAIMVADGLSNTEIAEELGIGATTVKSHVSALLTKFEVRNRILLAVAVIESGLQ
ncbi:MAG: response regulator transcription factor [Actinomycetaceae bacterium]|nr:response regulator transcription factor [Actinomycetaceae bacterium]